MGINTTLRGIIALFLIGFVWIGFMPQMNNLVNDDNIWGDVVDSRALFIKDNAMNLYYIGGIIALFATIIWMFNSAQSRGAASIYG